MKGKIATAAGLVAAAIVTASPAAAQDGGDSPWFIRVAATRLTLADKIDLSVAGTSVPGAGIDTPPHYTPTVQIGRYVGRDFAIVVTGGLPPHIKITGTDTLAPYGRLAETTYGPATLTVQYHPIHSGVVQPYVGVGGCYMHVFSTKDGAFQNVKIDDDLSPAVEAGSEFMIKPKFGVFVEAKKAWLRTTAYGTFGGAPVVGDVKLDPWALSAGVVFRF